MKRWSVLGLGLALAAGARAGAVFISGDDAEDLNHCQGTACGGLYPRVLTMLYGECLPLPEQKGILAIGCNVACGGAFCASLPRLALESWNSPANLGPGAPITYITDPLQIQSVRFEDYTMVFLPSHALHVTGGITDPQLSAVNARGPDLKTYVNDNNGRILALTEQGSPFAWGWLPNPLTSQAICDADIDPAPDMDTQFPGSGATPLNMDHSCYHSAWTGPPGWSGLYVLAVSKVTRIPDPNDPTATIDAPVVMGGCNLRVSAEICGDGIDNDGDGKADHDDEDCWVCGNNWLDPGEECDDGNLISGDGCDGACKIEAGSPCLNPPAAIDPLKGVKRMPDAVWSWPAETNSANGYRLYTVVVKTELDATQAGKGANGGNPNAARSCETFAVNDLTCTTAGVVPLPPALLFNQVVGVCGLIEGAN